MDWPFALSFGVSLVLGVLPYGVKTMDERVFYLLFGAGWFFIIWGLILCWREIRGQRKSPKQNKKLVLEILHALKAELEAIGSQGVLTYRRVKEAKEELDRWKLKAVRLLEKRCGTVEAGRFQQIVSDFEERDGYRQPGVGPVRAFLEEKERFLNYLEGLVEHLRGQDRV